MQIVVNGESQQLEPQASVAALVAARRPTPPFAVELNKHVVRRPDYPNTILRDGDRVEIVTLVGGG